MKNCENVKLFIIGVAAILFLVYATIVCFVFNTII